MTDPTIDNLQGRIDYLSAHLTTLKSALAESRREINDATRKAKNNFTAALNLAARVVDEEAILFDQEAAELLPAEDETAETKEAWQAHDQSRGRAMSLRRLATTIRYIKQKRPS